MSVDCHWVSNDKDDVGHLVNIDKLYPRLVVFVILPGERVNLESWSKCAGEVDDHALVAVVKRKWWCCMLLR